MWFGSRDYALLFTCPTGIYALGTRFLRGRIKPALRAFAQRPLQFQDFVFRTDVVTSVFRHDFPQNPFKHAFGSNQRIGRLSRRAESKTDHDFFVGRCLCAIEKCIQQTNFGLVSRNSG